MFRTALRYKYNLYQGEEGERVGRGMIGRGEDGGQELGEEDEKREGVDRAR